VTTKEQLHHLVDSLADDQAERALLLLESIAVPAGAGPERRRLPASLGIGESGRTDVSQRVDELLADGFGR
jgi:hypothetical protein